jgi:hypothetical protein
MPLEGATSIVLIYIYIYITRKINFLNLKERNHESSIKQVTAYGTKLFATVPVSSINSWDSWFILTCEKINTCYYTHNFTTYSYMGKDQERMLVVTISLPMH